MGLINFSDFPTNHDSYKAAVKHLATSKGVSFQKRPSRFFVITDTNKSTVIQGLNMDERIAAFSTGTARGGEGCEEVIDVSVQSGTGSPTRGDRGLHV